MLTKKIEAVVEQLKAPLTSEEQRAGWTRQSKDGYVPYFEGLLKSIQNNEKIVYSPLIRSLDAWGIGDGELYKSMMAISNEVNAASR